MSRWQQVFAVIALFWTVAVAWGSLTPAADMPQHLPWDKFNHFVAYAGLAVWLRLSGQRWTLSLAASVGFSVAIELLQIPVPGREGGDWEDILANLLGALFGLLLVRVGRYWSASSNANQAS